MKQEEFGSIEPQSDARKVVIPSFVLYFVTIASQSHMLLRALPMRNWRNQSPYSEVGYCVIGFMVVLSSASKDKAYGSFAAIRMQPFGACGVGRVGCDPVHIAKE